MKKYNFKDYLTLDGLVGWGLSMGGLVVTFVVLMYAAIIVQQNQASNFYSIDTDIHKIKALGDNQSQYIKMKD